MIPDGSEAPGSLDREARIREFCLKALERRMHSRFELLQKLRQRGFDGEEAAPILDRLGEVGLVNDAAFAEAWVASRQRTRPRGRRGLAAELQRKGIPSDVISQVLQDQDDMEVPGEAARRALEPKLRSWAGKPPEQIRQKAERFLLSRGFSYGEALDALASLPTEE